MSGLAQQLHQLKNRKRPKRKGMANQSVYVCLHFIQCFCLRMLKAPQETIQTTREEEGGRGGNGSDVHQRPVSVSRQEKRGAGCHW